MTSSPEELQALSDVELIAFYVAQVARRFEVVTGFTAHDDGDVFDLTMDACSQRIESAEDEMQRRGVEVTALLGAYLEHPNPAVRLEAAKAVLSTDTVTGLDVLDRLAMLRGNGMNWVAGPALMFANHQRGVTKLANPFPDHPHVQALPERLAAMERDAQDNTQ